ncbi:MAG: hypothetical protein ABSF15_21860 [Candidatus Sulfotelmatobacter sp.]
MGALARGELIRYDAKSAGLVPFLSGISADSVSFSKDGQSVAYVTFPEGTLWVSKSDGSQRVQLSFPPLYAMQPRWSPAGKEVVFFDFSPGQKAKVYTVSIDGGAPRKMIPDDLEEQLDPYWSPDGTRIVFGGASSDPNTTIRPRLRFLRNFSRAEAARGWAALVETSSPSRWGCCRSSGRWQRSEAGSRSFGGRGSGPKLDFQVALSA